MEQCILRRFNVDKISKDYPLITLRCDFLIIYVHFKKQQRNEYNEKLK